MSPAEQAKTIRPLTYKGRRVTMTDLLDARLIEPGENLVFPRPRLGATYYATVEANGTVVLPTAR